MYVQDSIKLKLRLTLNTGLRYAFQTTPGSFANFGPRVGLSWAPDKKANWVIHLRTGLFNNSPTNLIYAAEVYRLNRVRQQSTTVYSPGYSNPLNLIPGAIKVSTIDEFPHSSLSQISSFVALLDVEHDFPQHWHGGTHLYWGEDYNGIRRRNINAPMINSSTGIAPI